ncbi:hypothetical protein OO013_07770 [Mangrovivirga sp. M17]|uniref:Uncharacterized protein n=1 Tax=Mangrovivirga halotolerans TaxID=2993936 RepID=A0ABT3RQ97_9BACT|nr:hypothetical protein [Mangrovivirga halotolerans]MCX2743757.1 hypothetical protein [Mangrovivirga halotolerans]
MDKETMIRQFLYTIEANKTVNFDQVFFEFLIYHNGEMDSENPYKYEIKNKNLLEYSMAV